MEIKPAIIPKSVEDLADFAHEMKGAGGGKFTTLHIDMCDGEFVKNKSWLFNHRSDTDELKNFGDSGDGLPLWQDFDYEVDLMVKDPLPLMESWLHAGASSFVVHAEGIDENVFKELLEKAHSLESTLILAFNPQTDISKFESWIPLADAVQCMGISRIGFQGEPFDERVFEQIKKIKSINSEISIQVDGAVNSENSDILESLGATCLVVGSAIEDFLSN